MNDQNRNTILAVILSGMVLIGWQYLFVAPQVEKQQAAQKAQQQAQQTQTPGRLRSRVALRTGARAARWRSPGARSAAAGGSPVSRDAVLEASPRVKIETPKVSGTIALRGGRIDDVSLTQYRVTVDPKSPAITLFSPSGSPNPYYAEFGWVGASGANVKLPDAATDWKRQGAIRSPSPRP